MRCAIVQPSYIPWRGYFDIIRRSDIFVFYDDVQYDRRGWRNRNRIKTPHGSRWLTIPVHARGAQTTGLPIHQVRTVDSSWPRDHARALAGAYGRAPHFSEYEPWLQATYAHRSDFLADFTIARTVELAEMLGIRNTRFVRSSSLKVNGTKTNRLLAVLREVGGTRYLSGPSARHYLDEEALGHAGVELEWMTYAYPEYPQLFGEFDPYVTILDLLFMAGKDAPKFIWGGE